MATTPSATKHRDHRAVERWLPVTRKGQLKRRLSWDHKLHVLDPTSPGELTERRLATFQRIFAYRYSQASTTKPGQGPRSWTKLIGGLGLKHIARHLLGDRVPSLRPVWVAARSLSTSLFFCLDVDADRKPEQQFEDECGWNILEHEEGAELLEWWRLRRPARPPVPSFQDRCQYVEACLRWLGINPDDPSQVLIETTPRGGRHYYVFFDQPYYLDQYRSLLETIGLEFCDGQVEFFPSTTKALRLPFGHNPQVGTRPHAWLNFVRRWNQGRIKRHSLAALYEAVNERINAERPQPPEVKTFQVADIRQPSPIRHGVPRRYQDLTTSTQSTSRDVPRYLQLVEDGPHSVAVVNELLELGIRVPGTRVAALKVLVAHHIFIRGQSAKEAAKTLTDWALNERHESRDIQRDLATGTTVVAKDIERLCQWYEKQRHPHRLIAGKGVATAGFAPAEIRTLYSQIRHLPAEERQLIAQFLLGFLRFAKLHGKAAEDNTGWDAEASVKHVIRNWPGCHHMNYKTRVDAAIELGLLSIIKGAWHNPKGKGRARTYHLAIPVTNKNEWTLSYDDALNQLTHGPVVAGGIQVDTPALPPSESCPRRKEITHVHRYHDRRADYSHSQARSHHHDRVHPAPVRPQSPRISLAQGPRQRKPQPATDPGLRRPAPTELPTVHSLTQRWRGISLAGLPP